MKYDIDKIKFKNYCWSIGNTSFRMENFNYKIEKQLIHLRDFFLNAKNKNLEWNPETQRKYYNYLKECNFVKGDAPRPDKDAREKTAGMRDLGLITDDRRITEVGYELIRISEENKFKSNNIFYIDADSYIYLCQLLKMSIESGIKPFVNFLRIVDEFDYLTENEFKYLLPLTISDYHTDMIIDSISSLRNHNGNIDDYLLFFIKKMDNYKNAYQYFLDNEPSEAVFKIINMNRKSKNNDGLYYHIYNDFIDVFVNKKYNKIISLFDNIAKISGKPSSMWKKLLFNTSSRKKVINDQELCLNNISINSNSVENEIKEFFFYNTHLFKWKSNLSDYYDLNRRHFNTTDIVIFKDSKVYLSTTAKYYFKHCILDYAENIDNYSTNLTELTSIEKVLGPYVPNLENVYADIAADFDQEYLDPSEIDQYLEDRRLQEFNNLIDKKFDNDSLIKYLTYFESREDKKLAEELTDDADVPTLFEYISAICWYKLSDKKGNILDYMHLSLQTNLMPKQHAGGGEADILYSYSKTSYYPKHSLVLEATLSDSITQRRMEMEPVTRHLMRQLTESNNLNDYAILLSTTIHPSVVSDYRGKAFTENTLDNIHVFNGLKILTIDTKVLKSMLLNNIKYPQIYSILDDAYHSKESIVNWYKKEIVEKF